jgi:hypothetical protein
MLRLWNLLVERSGGGKVGLEQVCAVARTTAGVDGAAIAVHLATTPRETLAVSGEVAEGLEDLVLTLGEGPSVDAMFADLVLVADLDDPQHRSRWPMFVSAALATGIHAVFAFPLRIGGVRIGVMSLCRGRAGNLEPEQLADALGLADTACALLLDAASTPGPHNGNPPEPAVGQHPEVHQATGMVTVQLGVSAAVALVRLRAYAYANDRNLREVAGDVVARRLRFSPEKTGDGRQDRDQDSG